VNSLLLQFYNVAFFIRFWNWNNVKKLQWPEIKKP